VGREVKTAKFWLSPVRQAYNYRLAPNELNRIQSLVQQHEAELIKAWHEYFKPSDRRNATAARAPPHPADPSSPCRRAAAG
jgi:hypothetical protein